MIDLFVDECSRNCICSYESIAIHRSTIFTRMVALESLGVNPNNFYELYR